MAVAGIGAGMVIAALFSFILAAVDDDEIGSASGVLSAAQAVGGSIGVAVFGSVFFARAATDDFTGGFHHALIVQACLLVVFLAITFLLPERGRPEDRQERSISPRNHSRRLRRQAAPHRLSPGPGAGIRLPPARAGTDRAPKPPPEAGEDEKGGREAS
ncbi:hypothetical protein SCALM49S_09174 [Streptomyces californicus]